MKLKNEIPLIAIVSLPFIYLAYIWNELPEKVPMHWNIKGEIDRFGEKSELLLIPILLPLLVYIVPIRTPTISYKPAWYVLLNILNTSLFFLCNIIKMLTFKLLSILHSSKCTNFILYSKL